MLIWCIVVDAASPIVSYPLYLLPIRTFQTQWLDCFVVLCCTHCNCLQQNEEKPITFACPSPAHYDCTTQHWEVTTDEASCWESPPGQCMDAIILTSRRQPFRGLVGFQMQSCFMLQNISLSLKRSKDAITGLFCKCGSKPSLMKGWELAHLLDEPIRPNSHSGGIIGTDKDDNCNSIANAPIQYHDDCWDYSAPTASMRLSQVNTTSLRSTFMAIRTRLLITKLPLQVKNPTQRRISKTQFDWPR